MAQFNKNLQYVKFSSYGFLRNLRFFDAFFILFLVQEGLSYTQIGILYAIREFAINLLEIPSGVLADTFGRRRTLVISFLSYIVSFLIFFLSNNFYLYLLAFISLWCRDAFRSGTHKGLIMTYLKQNGLVGSKNIILRTYAILVTARRSPVFADCRTYYFCRRKLQKYFSSLNTTLYLEPFSCSILPQRIGRNDKTCQENNSCRYIQGFDHVTQEFQGDQTDLSIGIAFSISESHQGLHSNCHVTGCLSNTLDFRHQTRATERFAYRTFLFYHLPYHVFCIQIRITLESKNKNIVLLTLIAGFAAGIISGLFFELGAMIIALLSFVMIYIIENIRKPILTGYVADQVREEILSSVLSAQSQIKTIMTAVIALNFRGNCGYIGRSMVIDHYICISDVHYFSSEHDQIKEKLIFPP